MNINEEHPGATTTAEEPVADLLKDLRDESITLIRQQVELAKTETLEKISKLMRNAVNLFAGSLVATVGLLFILAGLDFLGALGLQAVGLSQSLALSISSPVIGLIVGIIGYVFVRKAISTFKHTSVVPEKTVHSIKEDQQWLAKKR